MRTRLIAIGNSRGVRLPKSVIDEAGLEDEIELTAQAGCIVLRARKNPRAGWDEQFARALKRNRGTVDTLLPDDIPNEFDRKGWVW
jgi:antitoxin MazE